MLKSKLQTKGLTKEGAGTIALGKAPDTGLDKLKTGIVSPLKLQAGARRKAGKTKP